MTELRLSKDTIVTRGKEEQIDFKSGRINVAPAWRFFLNLQKTADQ